MVTVEQFCKVFNANIIKESIMSDGQLTGTVTFKKHEGQGTDRERVSLKINEEWYGIFPANEKTDEVTAQVVREVKDGDEISIEFYRNQKGFLTISKALAVTHVDGETKPPSTPKPASSGYTKKAGGGGWVKQSAPPDEVEKAKQPAFAMSYGKDVTVALIDKGIIKDQATAEVVLVAIARAAYAAMKGMA